MQNRRWPKDVLRNQASSKPKASSSGLRNTAIAFLAIWASTAVAEGEGLKSFEDKDMGAIAARLARALVSCPGFRRAGVPVGIDVSNHTDEHLDKEKLRSAVEKANRARLGTTSDGEGGLELVLTSEKSEGAGHYRAKYALEAHWARGREAACIKTVTLEKSGVP